MKVEVRAFQGELMIQRVLSVPRDAIEVQPQDGQYVVGHSETGHHHVVDAQHCQMYEPPGNDLVCYLRLAEPTMLTHLRGHDTHAPLELPAGVWEVHRQREWTPEGERRALD